MSEGKTYFYETEVQWTGAKDLKLSGGKQPSIAAGAPPEFHGREENWSPEHLFVASLNSCYVLTLIAIAEFSKVALVSLSSTAKGKLEKAARERLSDHRDCRKAKGRSCVGWRSLAHAADTGKSQRELFCLQLDQEHDQDRTPSLSSSDPDLSLPLVRSSGLRHLHGDGSAVTDLRNICIKPRLFASEGPSRTSQTKRSMMPVEFLLN